MNVDPISSSLEKCISGFPIFWPLICRLAGADLTNPGEKIEVSSYHTCNWVRSAGSGCSVSHGRKGKSLGGHTQWLLVASEGLRREAARQVDDAEAGHGPLPRAGPGGGVAVVGEAVVDEKFQYLTLNSQASEYLTSNSQAFQYLTLRMRIVSIRIEPSFQVIF